MANALDKLLPDKLYRLQLTVVNCASEIKSALKTGEVEFDMDADNNSNNSFHADNPYELTKERSTNGRKKSISGISR